MKTKSAHPSPVQSALRPRLDVTKVLDCSYGHYPWDDWHGWAITQGLGEDLAGAGRLLIREAFNHGWETWLQNHCGWGDDGQALLAFARRAPVAARQQWDVLMRTDGLRGDYPSPKAHWTWGYLKSDAQRLLSTLNPQR